MTESLRGKFLVAGPQLRDTNFFKTVILLIEHAGDGAMGLVVNRPSSLTVGNALAGHLEVHDGEEMVFVGGPVEPADLFLIHSDQGVAAAYGGPVEILPQLYVTNSAEQFEAVLTSNSHGVWRKVFSGYAGWGPSQLEMELSRGDWLIAEAEPSHLFRTSAYDLWDKLKDIVSRSHRIFPGDVQNPELN